MQDNATVERGGERITFSPNAGGVKLFTTERVQRSTVDAEVIAPARVVASVSRPLSGESGGIVLFDTPDETSLYSTFIQNSTALQKARKNLDRAKELFAGNLASAKDVSDAEADVSSANATLAEVEGKIRAAGLNPEEFKNAQPGVLWLISDVPETLLYEVQQGETTSITFNSFAGETFKGRVEAVGEVIDNTTRTVKVRIILQNPQGRLKPGMFAKVNFGRSEANVMSVPIGAIVSVLGKNYVFIKTAERQYTRREITLGRQTGNRVVIANGLATGDEVVVEGAVLLKGLSFGY